jgi:hypothetical protein
MPRLNGDLRLDDAILGPEFSVRVMSVMKMHGIETISDLRAAMDEGLHRLRGLGAKSQKEIEDYMKNNDSDESLFQTEEYLRYRLEDNLGSATALMHDVQTHLLRIAQKGRVTTETRKHLQLKLMDAASRVMQLPTYEGD